MSELHECARRITWAGGTHVFNLAHPVVMRMLAGAVAPLPTVLVMTGDYVGGKCLAGEYGATPAAAMKRFNDGIYSVGDVVNIIELGLYGGGDVSAADAVDLVNRHVRGRALGPSAQLAFEILAALFVGAVPAEG
jgi:hypothetical protein